MRRSNKKKNRFFILLIILLGVTIGFAALSTTLKIKGITSVGKPTWSIYWTNPQVVSGSVTSNNPVIGEDTGEPENTKATWTTALNLPGDFYEFTIDAVNSGSVDAMITKIDRLVTDSNDTPTSLPDYIDYTVTYDDGGAVELNQTLPSNSTQKYRVRIYYDMEKMTAAEIEAMPAGGLVYNFSFEVTYSLATEDAVKPNLRMGEYFVMCPDDATASTNYPGFSGSTPTVDQCLWRVINLNNDGTIDAVSHYASTNEFTVTGTAGYTYFVAGMQDIASHYAKVGYTVKTRMMGYNGQTSIIQDTYAYNGASWDPPSTASTPDVSGMGTEYEKGVLGDTLYIKDYNLIKTTYGNSMNCVTKAGNMPGCFIASRKYNYTSTVNFSFCVCYTNSSRVVRSRTYSQYGNRWSDGNATGAVRPIITIIGNVYKESGDGSFENPYYINNRNGWFLTNSKTPMSGQKTQYWDNGTKIESGWHNLNDMSGNPNTYYFENGFAYHGWLEQSGNKYYLSTFDDDGNGYIDGRRLNGETREIDGVSYTFDANGVCTNCN